MGERMLSGAPSDGVSGLAFSPVKSHALLVSSWDATTRLYDTHNNISKYTYDFGAACLGCTFDSKGDAGFSCGLSGEVHSLDLERGIKTSLGSHEKAASCIESCVHTNTVLTGSWDGTIVNWDIRSPGRKLAAVAIPQRVYCMSSLGTNIVVGASERTIYMYDVRNLAVPAQVRESPLKYQTSSVACNLNGDGFALGSVEGRVAIEYFDMDPSIQAKKYSFKCHRTAEAAYPVRAIAFHPVYGTFATGGCDGTVSLWDGANKKRLAQLRAYPTSIAALAFSHDGSTLAIASSYTYEEGEKEHPEDNIYLKPLDDAEIRPRTKV